MCSGQQRARQRGGQLARGERHQVRAGRRALVEEDLARVRRPTRDQIHDAAQCLWPVQHRRRALDHLGLSKIEWHDVYERKAACLRAVQRQSVLKDRRVSAGQSLEAHVRRAERRPRFLSHPAHLAEQRRRLGWAHLRFLANVVATEHFHAQRFLLEPPLRTRRRDDDRCDLRGLRDQADIPRSLGAQAGRRGEEDNARRDPTPDCRAQSTGFRVRRRTFSTRPRIRRRRARSLPGRRTHRAALDPACSACACARSARRGVRSGLQRRPPRRCRSPSARRDTCA